MRMIIRKSANYKWVIFGTCLFWELTLTSLVLPDSLYLVPVTTALGFSRTQFSLVFSVRSMVQLIGNLLYGKFYERFRTKPLMICGTICMVCGYMIYARASVIWIFYVAAGIIGFASSLISATSMNIVLNSWFDKSVGKVFGVTLAGSSVGGAALSVIVGNMIVEFGYSRSYCITGIIALLSAVPVLLLAYERTEGGVREKETRTNESSLSVKGFLSDPLIRAELLVCFAAGLTIYPMESNISARMVDCGFTSEFGASMLGASLLISAVGKVILGALYDKWGLKKSVAAGMGIFMLGAILFIFIDSLVSAYLFVIIFGVSIANIVTWPPLLAKYSLTGIDYGKFVGWYSAIMAAGNMIGFVLMSAAYDFFGSYAPIVILQVIIVGSAIAAFARVYDYELLKEGESEYGKAKRSKD